MKPETMAAIHAACFPDRPWSAQEIIEMLCAPGTCAYAASDAAGFAIVRAVLDEAELLTIAIAPEARGRGKGHALLCGLMHALAAEDIRRLHLDVADDNHAAQALYAKTGFADMGRRRAYYPRGAGPAADARLLTCDLGDLSALPLGQAARIG